jgi:hypothetical protein
MKLKALFIITLILIICQNTALAQNAVITNPSIANTRDDLLLYFDVNGAFTEDMKNAILSGVPATFSFIVALYKNRTFWMDEKIMEINFTHTIKYNNLKKEFSVTRSWEVSKPLKTQSFEEAQKLMIKIDGLNVISLRSLDKGTAYKIKAKAELSKLQLPLRLHYVLFFLSLWDFETEWQEIDFTY